MRVLLVEDDATAARGVAFQLRREAMVVDIADTGQEAIELAGRYDYDVIVLDMMLPDVDGLDVLSQLRLAKLQVPVLILSAVGKTQAKINGLRLGADDYLSKPFDGSELVARIHALVRRSKGHAQAAIEIGALKVDLSAKEVRYNDKAVNLTLKEYMIVELLVLRRGSVLSKENFLDHLYGGIDEPDAKIIDVFICKIRKKMASAGLKNLIQTVWGRGYIMRDIGGGSAGAEAPAGLGAGYAAAAAAGT